MLLLHKRQPLSPHGQQKTLPFQTPRVVSTVLHYNGWTCCKVNARTETLIYTMDGQHTLEQALQESLLQPADRPPSSASGLTNLISRILSLACPIALQNFLYMLLAIINTSCVGHLGAAPLAAVVLAQGVYNVTGQSLVWGLACGLETLAGQVRGLGVVVRGGVCFVVLQHIPCT